MRSAMLGILLNPSCYEIRNYLPSPLTMQPCARRVLALLIALEIFDLKPLP